MEIILILLYLLSIILCKYIWKYTGPKYYNIWLEKDSNSISIIWFLPLLNTLIVLILGGEILLYYIDRKINDKK